MTTNTGPYELNDKSLYEWIQISQAEAYQGRSRKSFKVSNNGDVKPVAVFPELTKEFDMYFES